MIIQSNSEFIRSFISFVIVNMNKTVVSSIFVVIRLVKMFVYI